MVLLIVRHTQEMLSETITLSPHMHPNNSQNITESHRKIFEVLIEI